MTQDTYEINTYDAVSGKSSSRTVQKLPTPQRLQPPAPIEKGELKQMIDALWHEMGEQQERFDHKDELDGSATRNELRYPPESAS